MLRRSPRRTSALLAANRLNAQKSTGPRTALGRRHSAANAFRIGDRTSLDFWTRCLSGRELAEYRALRHALDTALLDHTGGQRLVGVATNLVWAMRRIWERDLRNLPPQVRRRLAIERLARPRVWHRTILRPGPAQGESRGPTEDRIEGQAEDVSQPLHDRATGWKVTISVLIRRGRCPGWMGRSRLSRVAHVITKVTCTRHPFFDVGCEGVALSTMPAALRTKPECFTKQAGSENVSAHRHGSGTPGAGPDKSSAGSEAATATRTGDDGGAGPESMTGSRAGPASGAADSGKKGHGLAARLRAWASEWLCAARRQSRKKKAVDSRRSKVDS